MIHIVRNAMTVDSDIVRNSDAIYTKDCKIVRILSTEDTNIVINDIYINDKAR